jgi:hypothetical protein
LRQGEAAMKEAHKKDLLETYRAIQKENRNGLKLFEGGAIMRCNGRDVTDEQTAMLKAQIAELDRIIAEVEAEPVD